MALDHADVLARIDGIEVRGTGALHLSRGTASLAPLREVLDTLDPATLAAVDADLAGELDGVVEEWTDTAICDSHGTIAGPERARCAALDSECGRGRLRDGADCCDVDLAPAGTLCDAGVCDGLGACETREPTDEERRLGVYSWVEALTPGVPVDWDGERVVLRIDEASVVDMPRDEARRARSRIATTGADATFGAALYDGPAAGRELRVPRTSDSSEICVVTGRVDEHSWIASDCTSAGAVVVSCPGANEGFRCELADGAFIVAADDSPELPSLAWQRTGAPAIDVLDAMAVATLCVDPTLCRFAPEQAGGAVGEGDLVALAACSPGAVTLCFKSGATGQCTGTKRCNAFGYWGGCTVVPETDCDGQDDDCDYQIDEGAAMGQCNDGRSCTNDACIRTTLFGSSFYLCNHWAIPDRCEVADDCAVPVCMGMTLSSADGIHPTDGYRPATPDANGCQQRLRHFRCEGADRCACNGANQCDPGAPGTDAEGCRPNEVLCNLDDDLCTNDRTCCEMSDSCVKFAGWTNEVRERFQSWCLDNSEGLTDMTMPGSTVSYTVSCGPGPQCPNDRIDCSDGNPCTQDLCNPLTGACSNPPSVVGVASGCGLPTDPDGRCGPLPAPTYTVLVEQGCGVMSCNGTGGCDLRRYAQPGSTTTECQDDAFGNPPIGGVGTCVRERCSAEGRCIGVPQHDLCDDGIACTTDVCQAPGVTILDPPSPLVLCGHTFPGGCAIDGMCLDAGTPHPTDLCRECRPSTSATSWSPSPVTRVGCSDDESCTTNDHCNGAGACTGTPIPGCLG